MTTFARSSLRRSAGFSLIEVMVGLLIGMLSVILIMQVFSSAEGAKRTTTSGNDAQINGNIALYGLERDIRDAGYGLNSFSLLGCSLTYKTGDAKGNVTLPVAPVNINPPADLVPFGDANTDTLLIISSTLNGPPEGDLLSAAPTGGVYPVATPASFAVDDLVVTQPAARPTPCALTRSKVTASDPTTITVDTAEPLVLGSLVFNLGRTLNVRAYAVRGGNLTVCDYGFNNCGNAAFVDNSAVWVPVANSIVSLRAQYGREIVDTTKLMTGVVDTYHQITPGSEPDKSGLAVQCGWARTLAVRLALVARSPQFEKGTPTTAAPKWAGTTVVTTSPVNPSALTIDLSANGEWQSYRYKTLETTVPIRNAVWQGGQTSC